ncbi:MAG: phosphoribosyltransferase [Planctomycetes bacterium]|nr:phosphoribosyltransferase [Phycisphaerae bacterium]NBB95749.1 phosphoribosyltransferase [Planctomycetota bacterium]
MSEHRNNILEDPDLHNTEYVFADRSDAGRSLANLLSDHVGSETIVLAIPAGGVPVAVTLAETLSLPLDVAVVSKITLPHNTESGYGAVAFDGTVRMNQQIVRSVGLSQNDVETGLNQTKQKVRNRAKLFRGDRPEPDLTGRPVILVDDGLASGVTMQTAVEAVGHRGAQQVIVAVPTGHANSVAAGARDVDTLYCANIREGLSFAVARAYQNWHDVSENEALELLQHTA